MSEPMSDEYLAWIADSIAGGPTHGWKTAMVQDMLTEIQRQRVALNRVQSLAMWLAGELYPRDLRHEQMVSMILATAGEQAPDLRCAASMSPGQGQTVRCFLDVGHNGRHHAYDWSWIDGPDDDARLEDHCPWIHS